MTFKKLSWYFLRLESTPSRNQKTALLAQLLKETSPEEIAPVVYLSAGRLAPLFESVEFNLAEKMMIKALNLAFNQPEREIRRLFRMHGDLGTAAEKLKSSPGLKGLKVSQVFQRLYQIAQEQGEGSQERKLQGLSSLIRDLDPLSVKYVVRIPLSTMRLGFSDLTLLDALSWMKGSDKSLRKDLEDAYNVSADIGLIAKIFKTKGLKGLKKIKASPGLPIRTAQAERLDSAEKIVEKLKCFAVEKKMDGFRVQIHLDKSRNMKTQEVLSKEQDKLWETRGPFVRLFSRNLEDTTFMFPDIVASAQKLPVRSAILDAEAIAFNPRTHKFLPFQETIQRKRKYGIKEASQDLPLKAFVFDLLYFNGKTLLAEPFQKRRLWLEKILPESDTLVLAEQKIVDNSHDLRKLFDQAVAENLEGVMAKKLDAVYQAGARNFNWVKYKRTTEGTGLADTLDCLVMGYYPGRGKRANLGLGGFLVGVYDDRSQKYETLSKIGTGLTDEQWQEMKKRCDRVAASYQPASYEVPKELKPSVWCRPQIVVEIKADEITRSPLHTAGKTKKRSGLALRFPRLVKFRDDKNPSQTTTVKEVLRLYRMQVGKR